MRIKLTVDVIAADHKAYIIYTVFREILHVCLVFVVTSFFLRCRLSSALLKKRAKNPHKTLINRKAENSLVCCFKPFF